MNTEAAVNISSKSQLAKLLAAENIHVQHSAAAQTASFDVKKRVLILPVWKKMSNDLYDMLVIHEVGHALDTPADGWLDAMTDISKRVNGLDTGRAVSSVKGFLNVVEDARIDKRQKRRFPGSRRNYVVGYKELFDRDFFGIANRDVNSLSFIDRMNIYFKGGFAMGIKFNAAEKVFIKRAEEAETWDDVLVLTEDIYRFAKENNDLEQNAKSDIDMSEEGDGEEYEGEGYGEDEADAEENENQKPYGRDYDDGDDDEEETDTDGEGDADDDGEEETDINDDENSTDGAGNDAEENLPEAETDRSFEERKRELVAANAEQYHYLKLPKPNLSKIVDDYKIVMKSWRQAWVATGSPQIMQPFNEWKSAENASISFMVKEFESKKAADIYSRVSIAKTGVIDTNKLHTYKYNDDIFRRLSVVPNGKNHGFVMFIDWSGSMDQYIKETIKQLCSMVLFCKRVQIPFEVYLFRSVNVHETSEADQYFGNTLNSEYVNLAPFKLRNILSSRMNGADLNFAMAYLQFYRGRNHYDGDFMGSTPLNQAIVAADAVLDDFRRKNKVQVLNTVFLTDGESDPVNVNLIMRSKDRVIVQDDVTHKEYDIGSFDYRRNITNVLLRRLKDRTNCNLIGFFLTNGSFSRNYDMNVGFGSYEYRVKMEKFWKDNGFMPSTSQGYDKYFLVNTKNLNIVSGNLQVNGDMSRAKIASAFMKFSEKKTVNRILLRQFIDLVCA